MQKVKCHQELLKYHPQDWRRETPDRVPSEKSLHAIPEWRVHETVMLAIRPRHFERVEKSAYCIAAWMLG
jgi:hypothetical protein